VVVVLGIGLSFYVDDLRQHEYDVEMKNRSLLRIRANIHSDIQDAEWNIHLHKTVIRSCNTLLSKHTLFRPRQRFIVETFEIPVDGQLDFFGQHRGI